jgi:hypothetical protein
VLYLLSRYKLHVDSCARTVVTEMLRSEERLVI